MNYDYSFRSWKGKEADYCLEPLKGVAALPTLVSEQWNIFGTSDFHDEKTFFFSCWVAQSCPTLCDYMEWSMPGFPVLYHLPELTQTHVQWVSDAIQPSRLCHPLLPLPSIFPSSGSFLMSDSWHQVAKVLELQLQLQSSQWISRVYPIACESAKSLQSCLSLQFYWL